ncbi:tRNA pseudouridine(55) synthase TruB [Mycoplasmopsis primatum]|uniref:tRNA pseudouridine(55) synthase TruB n=1 Tax=Mycoplasmopsis primatum TaxID=55604 RepID=UPI0004959902|nr:tRNA pseudouridine(55) synthase TruB [Mycoplasmopsis primatum]
MFYLLNKPKGYSSFYVIKEFAKQNSIQKIGHTGTLDPLASGLLLIATDSDTKLIPYISHNDKTYETVIQFGCQTDTYDADGKIINSSNTIITEQDISKVTDWLLRQESQIPPIYSAKKINGIRSYDLARNNKNISLKSQNIKVYEAKIIEFNFHKQQLKLSLKVSKGTYIRSLINDLGIYLNSYAYMTQLNRTAIGTLNINLLNGNNFVKISTTHLFNIPFFTPSKNEFELLKNGVAIANNKNLVSGKYMLKNNEIIWGIVEIDNLKITVKKIFGNKLNQILVGSKNE